MTKSADAVVYLLGQLKLESIALVVKNLSIDEIKILNSEVLPQINDLALKGSLRKLLTERASDVYQNKENKDRLHNKTLSEQLNSLFDMFAQSILDELSDSQSKSLFLQKATEEELFLIHKKLRRSKQGVYEREFAQSIRNELDRRESINPSLDWRTQYNAFGLDKLAEPQLWNQVKSRVKDVNLDVKNASAAEAKTIKEEPPVIKSLSIWQRVVQFFAQVWSYFTSFFFSRKKKETPANINDARVDLSDDEETRFESMRSYGIRYANELTGKTGLGESKIRTKEEREASIRARYGIVLSSQVVAGGRGKKHGQISTVAESLADTNDSDVTIESIYNAILKSKSVDEKNPLTDIHIFSAPGDDALVTALETLDLKNLLGVGARYNEYGLHFSPEEKASIEEYKRNTDRSKSLNNAIAAFSFSWGGYEQDKKGGFKKIDEGFEVEQEKFEKNVSALSKSVLNACAALQDGESLYLDTGLEGHAMKLAIQRVGGEFKLTCYDSSGALENSTQSQSLFGLLKLNAMGAAAKRSNALTFSIPVERIISPKGLNYFNNLIRQHSFAGWAETNIHENLTHSTMEERSRMGVFGRMMALREQSRIYLAYINKFTAIADPDSPPKFDTLLQHAQNTSNCFAKRLQSAQLYELGKPVYKKLRMAVLIEQKNGMIADICGKRSSQKGEEDEEPFLGAEYTYMIKNIQPEILSPEELHEASLRLSEISETPSQEYYQQFFKNLLAARDTLSKKNSSDNNLTVKRIDTKIANHAKSYYSYLKQGNRVDEIKQVFAPEVYNADNNFNWTSGKLALKNVDGVIDETALSMLSEYATAQAWKASIQLINHQIKKIGVNERHIHSPAQRVEHAGYREAARSIKLEDLEQANIVNFTTGFRRTEEIKIELNVGGKRKEIDKDTFFNLVIENTQALTSPKVMNLLDYLRNASPEMEKRYDSWVYPVQRKAFQEVLAANISETSSIMMKGVERLVQYETNIDQMISQNKKNLELVLDYIKREKDVIGSERNSIKLNNFTSRQKLIERELEHLLSIKRTIENKRNVLLDKHTVLDSANNKISYALHTLEIIRNNDPKMSKVKNIINGFANSQSQLESVVSQVEETLYAIENIDIEHGLSEKTKDLRNHRRQVISNCLEANAEYRILDELAAGRMGTEKQRDRNLYAQKTESDERKGKTGYVQGSVLAKIQHLGKKLQNKTYEIFESQLLLSTGTENALSSDWRQSLIGSARDYNSIEERMLEISKQSIPAEIKNEWVSEMFQIWLSHESLDVMTSISRKNDSEINAAVNKAFHYFIEQKTHIKFAALKGAGYPIELSEGQIKEMGWKQKSEEEIEQLQGQRAQAAMKILGYFKTLKPVIDKKNPARVKAKHEPISLKSGDLISPQHNATLSHQNFLGPKSVFLSQKDRETLESSTLKFLRENKIPQCTGTTEVECEQYYNDTLSYLVKLKSHLGLENKRERLIEFCLAASSTMFELPYPPNATVINDLSEAIINGYRGEDGQIKEAFLKLENTERNQILTALLKLALSRIEVGSRNEMTMSAESISIIRQWEKLIVPRDEGLSEKITMLTPGENTPQNITLLDEVDNAIRQSPIGLEGLYEGQKGLQIALTNYGKETALKSDLRKLADKLAMRNGETLLPIQFIHYYSDSELLFSVEGINSTQGREFFTRALLDAYQHANPDEKTALLQFLHAIKLDETTSKLKVPHEVFLHELLMRCILLEAKPGTYQSSSIDAFIKQLTDAISTNAEDRLFGFAKEINWLALKIEHALHDENRNEANLDRLYSQLICANLAYQSIIGQASADVLANLNSSFEYKKEMALVQSNINKLQDDLVHFSKNIGASGRGAVFASVFKEYSDAEKFDMRKINIISPVASDIPGFMNLGGIKSLDVLHGVVYVGNNKLGTMPSYIQSHISLQILGINNHPFIQEGGAYVYVEQGEVKASITQMGDANLVIQRELQTVDGTKGMLQYLSPNDTDSLPASIRNRINAEHFFIDSAGAIHGFTSDFKPVLKLSKNDELWVGELVNHNGGKNLIQLNSAPSSLIVKLIEIFPYEEMISMDVDTVYIPSLKRYVQNDETSENLYIFDNLEEKSSKRSLKLGKKGSAYTEKVLTPEQEKEVASIKSTIENLQEQLAAITHADLVSLQNKNKIINKINAKRDSLNQIISPEYLVFIADPEHVQKQEKKTQRLRETMDNSYLEHLGNIKDKEKGMVNYDVAKDAYLASAKQLKKSLSEAHHLITYKVDKNGKLIANDFQSILYVGTLAGKAPLFIQLLGKAVPKAPLLPNELESLRSLKKEYRHKSPLTPDDRVVFSLLTGIELQHHLLEREASLRGKIAGWDKPTYERLLNDFSKGVQDCNAEGKDQFPVSSFSELWREVQAEFESNETLHEILDSKSISVQPVEKKPININTKTTYMPIETIGGRTLVQFSPHNDFDSLRDEEQNQLQKRLHDLVDFRESIQAQEDGYHYENYGLFNKETIAQLFRVSATKTGISGLTQKNILLLFQWMNEQGWIKPATGTDKYQLAQHPGDSYSSQKVEGFLSEMGLNRNEMSAVTSRLEVFLYETAVNGGIYSIQEDKKSELIESIESAKDKYNLEVLLAEDKIQSVLEKASTDISMAELKAAYLLNDYSKIISYFPEQERVQIQLVFNNALTRLMYYQTELDHLNDIQDAFSKGNATKAVSMLHIRRNYRLELLLDSEVNAVERASKDGAFKIDQDRKMQRAFLLFESEFGHRCNARQVDIFRGLLLDDKNNPDKIDSAQARMGFGKTSLLPLVALYKTGGDKLVRFIVPKSALETNTADMTSVLNKLIDSRAVKDDFQRYRIEADPEANMGEESPRLKSLRDAKADLKKRLSLYKRVKDNKEVLVQAPNVRNALECQAKVFLDLLERFPDEPVQKKELMECITIINEIRSIATLSIFDELDATQDMATTDVNYTSGEKIPFNTDEIYPLELISKTICSAEDRSVNNLARILLDAFKISDPDSGILNYITSLEVKQSLSVTAQNSTEIYLIRAILTDPVLLSLFTEKEASTDYGVWFQNASDGSRVYDYSSTGEQGSKTPLLIVVPYAAANTPKPKGSRFDNPEVTAIATFLYYNDPRTTIEEIPHFEFLIDSFRNGIGDAPYRNQNGDISAEFATIFNDIKEIAEIEDPLIRNASRENYFATHFINSQENGGLRLPEALRSMLARTVIQQQIKFDAGKANSNRYEQGTANDTEIGFSGTAGDISSHFKNNKLDPAADGNMTLGIMGRKNCQKTITLNTSDFSYTGEDYTTSLIKQLAKSFNTNTRTLIDVGGLCKASNKAVAKIIAMELRNQNSTVKDNGVIFYDDITNTKKLLVLSEDNNETVLDLTSEMISDSDTKGIYFTYYDQDHTRGADIKQMDKALAVLTLHFSVTNNSFKQAIMRMRKIIDKSSGQAFSTAVPDNVRKQILSDLDLDADHELSGNDIAYWLRAKELQNNASNVSTLMMEMDSIVKNAILQQQAKITALCSAAGYEMDADKIAAFRSYIADLNKISPLISGNVAKLEDKYGKVFSSIKKEEFVADLKHKFEANLTTVFDLTDRIREQMNFVALSADDKKPYFDMEKSTLEKRVPQLANEFVIPTSSGSLSEVQSEVQCETESQSESQSQSQTQTHSFSQVSNEDVVVDAQLQKPAMSYEPAVLDYLINENDNENSLSDLPLASQTAHMQNLFNGDDSVRCSLAYAKEQQLTVDTDQPSPPVRYFLARETGNPQILLINQDEAELFKKKRGLEWSLYNLTLKKSDSITPVYGAPIKNLSEALLKKLYFSSFRYEIKGSNLEDVAESLEGICTPEQLMPSLDVQYKKGEGSFAEAQSVLHMDAWGFYGDKAQDLSFEVEQTQTIYEQRFEKKGVTVQLKQGNTQAEVFVSSKLNERILAAIDKKARDEQDADKPIATMIKRDIDQKCSEVKEQRQTNRKELGEQKARKSLVIKEFDLKMEELQLKRDEAILRAKNKIQASFKTDMKQYFDARTPQLALLHNNLNYFSQAKGFGNGNFTINRKKYPSIEEAINTLLVKELLGKSELSPQQREIQLDTLIKSISDASHDLYKNVTFYNKKNSTFIEELVANLNKIPKVRGNHRNLTTTFKQIQVWGDHFDAVLHEHFNAFYLNDDIWNKIKGCFDKALFDFLSGKDFENSLIAKLEVLGNQVDPSGNFFFEFMTTMSYSLNMGNPAKFEEAVRNDIGNSVKKMMLEQLSQPKENQESLFLEVSTLLKQKMKSYDYVLPQRLLDSQMNSTQEEIKAAIKQAMTNQNVKTTPQQIKVMAEDYVVYQAKQKAIMHVLERFSPVENRGAMVKDESGKELKLSSETHEALVEVDQEVLVIQRDIEAAKMQKKSLLQTIDHRIGEINAQLKVNNEQLKTLKAERSACSKLITGIKRLFSFFSEHQVNLSTDEPEAFLERHLDLDKVIRDEISLSTTLSFMPPAFYDVDEDMKAQSEDMHGLNKEEVRAKNTLNRAIALVKDDAKLVKMRSFQLDGVMQVSDVEQNPVKGGGYGTFNGYHTLYKKYHTIVDPIRKEDQLPPAAEPSDAFKLK